MARLFFQDHEAYQKWMQRMPGITPCYENLDDWRLLDPQDPCYPVEEGPYYVGPEYLLLRVGPGACARYNVLVRVDKEEQADYYLFIPPRQKGQEGEKVFAAYLWDRRQDPPKIVGGVTIREARAALNAFLSSKSVVSKLTRRLSS